ncbi:MULTISPECIES: hypothetical protein [unclassified Actinoplanes]|uniref:hypothetical protein n=1 Tax=unclassified Actinoplanes TaxID=2626549 RepID=UPI0012BB0FF2|nr:MULTISPECIES: hypothetical protein [unclassified Actinoplanes]
MNAPDRTAFTKRGAAVTGLAASVVFTLAVGGSQHEWTTGLMTGTAVGTFVFASHWFAARPRC